MVLPMKYQAQVLCLLHDSQGHLGIEGTIALCQEWFYLNNMFHNVTNYIKIIHDARQQRGITQIQKLNQVW